MDAFILRTYGTGNGPDADHALLDTFAKATAAGKLIVNPSAIVVLSIRVAMQQGQRWPGQVLLEDWTPQQKRCSANCTTCTLWA